MLRIGPTLSTLAPQISAMSPERCGPGPSFAIARKILTFLRSETIEADAEETLIEMRDNLGLGITDIAHGNRR